VRVHNAHAIRALMQVRQRCCIRKCSESCDACLAHSARCDSDFNCPATDGGLAVELAARIRCGYSTIHFEHARAISTNHSGITQRSEFSSAYTKFDAALRIHYGAARRQRETACHQTEATVAHRYYGVTVINSGLLGVDSPAFIRAPAKAR
jgi:hypothetical protein